MNDSFDEWMIQKEKTKREKDKKKEGKTGNEYRDGNTQNKLYNGSVWLCMALYGYYWY